MKLEHEIRKVMWAHKSPIHITVLRMRVLAERGDKSLPKQGLKRFINVTGEMPDVEAIGGGYRRFKKTEKHKRLHELKTRVTQWVKYYLSRLTSYSDQITKVTNYLRIKLKPLMTSLLKWMRR